MQEASMPVKLSGQIERITYTNPENGYTVAQMKVRGVRQMVTVVGNLVDPVPGEVMELTGRWKVHPRFGEQFEVQTYRTTAPATVTGIRKYLGSGLIKGIGPVMAKRIVSRFGKETLEVIENAPERLAEIQGVGEKRIAMITAAWAEQKEIRAVMMFLQSHNVSSGYATKIFKHYGSQAIEVVSENPYQLATDIFGIGFLTADRIARSLGFEKDSSLRLRAGVLYVLNHMAEDGHVFYPYSRLLEKAGEMLEVDAYPVADAVSHMARAGHVVMESLAAPEADTAVYLSKYYTCETGIAALLKRLLRTPKAIRAIDTDRALTWVQQRLAFTLAEKQAEAVSDAVRHKVMVITGGPGTGKTTIIRAVLQIFGKLAVNIRLAAPTGRASKQMSEATGFPASTIHRMLSFNAKGGGVQKNAGNPLDCDILIVDEASMIDTVLMYHLLKAVPQGATVILVGDVNQLPSVGAGNVLEDIIASGKVPVVRLNEIFRQARHSRIIVNAHRINQGYMPKIDAPQEESDFYFIEKEAPEAVLELILSLAESRIPKSFGFDPLADIQVLSPMHKGLVGAANLNRELQKRLNPGADGVTQGAATFCDGDKVMQIRNNYDKGVFNGDIGRICGLDREARELRIDFDGRRIAYDFTELDELVLAYAVSVHKSQGSEYPVVIVPVVTQHYILLQRNLIYTAVTRGRQLVVVVGTKKAMAIGIKNNRTQHRYTRLDLRLKWPAERFEKELLD
ncbi:MAG: ATP-dependent RecD-like DNA helicase [Thermodesulfobacteriota bacterium]